MISRSGRLSPGDPDRFLDDPVVARGGGAEGILVLRDPEKQDAGNTQLVDLGHGFTEPVEGKLVLAGHRRHLAAEVCAMIDE